MRVGFFSPLPPSTSGIAAYSAELLPLLRARGLDVDIFSDLNAHDFVWRHRRQPYDLTVFQMGNATCHDYMWGYLFRYPGMVVLHDAQLHQARALHLTRRWTPRRDDYLEEFHANHPDAPRDAGLLIAAGLGGTLYQIWPHLKLVIESARMTLVHNAWLADDLREKFPAARIAAIAMGVADPVAGLQTSDVGRETSNVRARHRIPNDAVVLAAYGGITPEKRMAQVVRALSAVAGRLPQLHLMLVGAPAAHYDVMADAQAWGVADRVHVTGFVSDEDLPSYLLVADICACLRWPTNRETSASWLRCIAAGRATILTELVHQHDVPTLDPRGWQLKDTSRDSREAVAVSIDVLDEDHSLQLALQRLTTDADLRQGLGRRARAWWEHHHQLAPMADAYERVIEVAGAAAARNVPLPPHLSKDGSERAAQIAEEMGVPLGDWSRGR